MLFLVFVVAMVVYACWWLLFVAFLFHLFSGFPFLEALAASVGCLVAIDCLFDFSLCSLTLVLLLVLFGLLCGVCSLSFSLIILFRCFCCLFCIFGFTRTLLPAAPCSFFSRSTPGCLCERDGGRDHLFASRFRLGRKL